MTALNPCLRVWLIRVTCLLTMAIPLAGAGAAVPELIAEQPLEAPRTIHLAERWRVGGDDPGLLFGLMIEAHSDEAGNTYLLDQQLCRVTVVGPDGEVLRHIGRQGEGPGEVRTPQSMALLADGTVALAEQFPGKLVKLTRDGLPAGIVTVGRAGAEGGFTALSSLKRRDDTLLVGALFQAPAEHGQSRQSYLASIDADGQELVRFCEHTTVLDFERAHFSEKAMLASFLGAHAIGPGGEIYAARDWNSYLIDVFGPDGTLQRTLGRKFEPLRRTKREKERVDALFEVEAKRMPFPITWDTEDNARTVVGLNVDGQGRLWVEHARSGHEQPDGILLTYDVFAPDGRWLHEASIACEGNPDYDGILFLQNGRLLLVKGLILAQLTASGSQGAVFDEDDQAATDLLEVICYEVIE